MKQTTTRTITFFIFLFSFFIWSCKDKPDDPPPQPPPQNASITFRDKSITVDYSGSGLTQEQADTVTPKLQEVFTNLMAIVADSSPGIKLATMVNRPGFKIVIIPGDSGCGRAGDTMTLGADFVLANDAQGIGNNIAPAILGDDLFADIPPQPATITLTFVSASGTPAVGNFNVTVKSDDTYTPAEWDAVVANVKTALETTYADSGTTPGDRINLRDVFGVADATVILKNDLAQNWEVKAGVTKGTLYIKSSAVSTITASSYAAATEAILQNNPATSQANAAPQKHRVFLAYMFSHSGNLILS